MAGDLSRPSVRNAFSARWHGQEEALAADRPDQENAYLSTRADDFDTRVVWAGEGVDLIHDSHRSGDHRTDRNQAAVTLMNGAKLVR